MGQGTYDVLNPTNLSLSLSFINIDCGWHSLIVLAKIDIDGSSTMGRPSDQRRDEGDDANEKSLIQRMIVRGRWLMDALIVHPSVVANTRLRYSTVVPTIKPSFGHVGRQPNEAKINISQEPSFEMEMRTFLTKRQRQ